MSGPSIRPAAHSYIYHIYFYLTEKYHISFEQTNIQVLNTLSSDSISWKLFNTLCGCVLATATTNRLYDALFSIRLNQFEGLYSIPYLYTRIESNRL